MQLSISTKPRVGEPAVGSRLDPIFPGVVHRPVIVRTWHWWCFRWPLAVILLATGVLYTVLAVALNAHLLTYGFDLGVYYEALRGYAHLGLPFVALKGTNSDLLGDHFEPMLAILAPTYWVWRSPSVLLVDQGILVALSVIPVWMFTERRFGSSTGTARVTTACLVATYALAWQIQSLLGYDFHSLAFAVPILAVAIERADAGRWRMATFWALSLLLVKEDLSLVVAAFGVYAFLCGRRRLGILLVGVGAAAFGVLVDVVIPAFAAGPYPHWSYQELGPGPWPALRYVVTHPLATLRVMVSPRTKIGLLAWVFLPGALLSLLSPIVVMAVPLLLERLLSQRPEVWQTEYQYNAPLAPIVGLAAIDGLWRVVQRWRSRQSSEENLSPGPCREEVASRRGRKLVTYLLPKGDGVALTAIGLWIAAVAITVHFPLSLLVAGDFQLFRPDPSVAAVDAAERVLPVGVTVAASNNLVPRLLNRDNPIVLTRDSVCGSWVMAWTGYPQAGYVRTAELLGQLRRMEQHGWRLVYKHAGIELLHQYGPGGGYVCRRDDPLLAPE